MSDDQTESQEESTELPEKALSLAEQSENLANLLQHADHEDLSQLADIHTMVEQFADALRSDAHGDAAAHIDVAIDHLNEVIFSEADHPVELLQSISRWLGEYANKLNNGEPPESLEGFTIDKIQADEETPITEETTEITDGDLPSTNEEEPEPQADNADNFFDEDTAEAPSADMADDTAFLYQTVSEGMEELVVDFVAEANDHLETCDVSLLTLETTPDETDALDAVFRGFHTIKGVAGFLHLEHILNLAHEAESLLVKARDNELTLEGQAIDVIFESADLLKRLIGSLDVSQGASESDVTGKELHTMIDRVKGVIEGRPSENDEASTPANYGRRADDEPVGDDPARLGDILVDKGMADRKVVEQAYTAQQLAQQPHKDLGEFLVAENLISLDMLTKAQERLINNPADGPLDRILISMELLTQKEMDTAKAKHEDKPKLGEVLVEVGVEAKTVAKALRLQKTTPRAAIQNKEYVKIDSDRLNNMIDMIGELVIAESMVTMSPELEDKMSPKLVRHMNQLDKITRDLQELGTSLRMVPVKATFQKMARIVRDLSKNSGKEVELILSGEDTELDKILVDKIGDPLVHMIRNAMDHGLELDADERQAAGKPSKGTVHLRAFHQGGSIYIEIEDDGRGLDRTAILNKAKEQGLITDGSNMEDKEVWNLIFEPGFSTAKKVTEVSGRGVGMDVVKRNIQELRGSVEITSEKGKGSIFSIQLPLTLAIIDGMTLRCGSQRYILPTLSVKRLMRPEEHDLSSVFNREKMLKVEGNLVPLFQLSRLFNIQDANHKLEECVIVVVENFDSIIALAVDEVLGQQQTVIKPLGESLQSSAAISGGAIMTDGTVGLILDPNGLIKLSQQKDKNQMLHSA